MTRSAALHHVAGQRERRAAEADDRQFRAKVFDHQLHRIGNISQLGSPVAAQYLYVCTVRTGFSMTGPSPAAK